MKFSFFILLVSDSNSHTFSVEFCFEETCGSYKNKIRATVVEENEYC